MRIEAFVPTWPGKKQHPGQIVDILSNHCDKITVLAAPDDYFNAQFQKARDIFQRGDSDVMVWAMADITLPDNFDELWTEMTWIMSRADVGWYAPNVDWTSFIFDLKDLEPVEEEQQIYEVPNTDSLFFAVRRDVLDKMPVIDPELCFMWAADFTAIATAKLMGYKVVRDYKFLVKHPNDTGYDIDEASVGMRDLFNSFDGPLKAEISRLIDQANRLKRLP